MYGQSSSNALLGKAKDYTSSVQKPSGSSRHWNSSDEVHEREVELPRKGSLFILYHTAYFQNPDGAICCPRTAMADFLTQFSTTNAYVNSKFRTTCMDIGKADQKERPIKTFQLAQFYSFCVITHEMNDGRIVSTYFMSKLGEFSLFRTKFNFWPRCFNYGTIEPVQCGHSHMMYRMIRSYVSLFELYFIKQTLKRIGRIPTGIIVNPKKSPLFLHKGQTAY